ncbi:hypothetical protein PQR62_06870 [Herbaspirillum lusitanum]|uniref:Uncharacterized protein n=1 Tax=Herbaspirillum lusitanum TaxID=213312 RepID=A0ABW9A6H0_9BURK
MNTPAMPQLTGADPIDSESVTPVANPDAKQEKVVANQKNQRPQIKPGGVSEAEQLLDEQNLAQDRRG